MAGRGRSFRRHTERFWHVWPVPDYVDEAHRVVYVDGIYLARDIVALIARSDDHVLYWHLAKAEGSRACKALLPKVAPPLMAVSDGGPGFAKAAREAWPGTEAQRCLFHVFCQVRRYTASKPKLQAGIEPHALAKGLLHIETPRQAELWFERFSGWCDSWSDFLSEKARTGRGLEYAHCRLRKARSPIVRVLGKGAMLTYLEPGLTLEGPMPSTSNLIEGATNAKTRGMPRSRRGMSATRGAKAAFWLCCMDAECPKSASEILQTMPTDDDIELLRQMRGAVPTDPLEPAGWGGGIVWEGFHHKTRYPFSTE